MSDREHDHVVVRELLRGYRLNGRVARASRVFVGQYDEGAEDAGESAVANGEEAEGELIGADEDSSPAEADEGIDDGPFDGSAIQEILDREADGEEPESK